MMNFKIGYVVLPMHSEGKIYIAKDDNGNAIGVADYKDLIEKYPIKTNKGGYYCRIQSFLPKDSKKQKLYIPSTALFSRTRNYKAHTTLIQK